MNKWTYGIILGASLVIHFPAQAEVFQFTAVLNGANETNGTGAFGVGDLDGTGIATLFIDSVTNTIDWNFAVNNIVLPLMGAHIHTGGASVNGPIVVNFSGQLTGTGLVDTDLASVLANPGNFYVNLHNADFTSGAIRGQITPVPEPATVGMMLAGLGLVGWRLRRRPV